MRKLILLLLIPFVSISQNSLEQINTYLERYTKDYNFELQDLNNLTIDSQHYSESLNSDLYYMQQNYNGIPVYNAIGNFVLKDNRVIRFNHSFENKLEERINSTLAQITPIEAVNQAITTLNIDANLSQTQVISARNTQEFILKNPTASNQKINVKLMFVPIQNELKLAWDVTLYEKTTQHWWSARIDALSGALINANDWLLSCNFEDHKHQIKSEDAPHTYNLLNASSDTGNYRAYPIPVESPNHGNRSLLSNTTNAASPFGWHDTNASIGPEFTITRGNNVYAQEDRNGNDGFGYSPEGGDQLNFDFSQDLNLPPAAYQDASITNLFVWNNLMHDVWYNYGFDEGAGNFQETNYNSAGFGGNDFVFADAQDGSGLNNANFGTPPDGFNPRMQMFLWSPAGQPNPPLSINTLGDLQGDYLSLPAAFGPEIPTTPIISDLVLVEDADATQDINDACDPLTNSNLITGKIAVIRRGSCAFVQKIERAQNSGAVAVIMVNNVLGNPIVMGGDSNTITIPSLMVSLEDGEAIINALNAGISLNATIVNNGPYEIDGSFDNVIIAHEYGHGISTRLTGGKNQANCLFNEEQMGEGWSDWMGMMMTIEAGDLGEDGRGIGTFAVSQPIDGNGIRPFRYSTDTTTNPSTYDLTNNPGLSVPHGVGFVWSTILWDLTWAFIDEYGFDADLYNGTGGNNKIMQLVIDGMKLQACEPGFIDGRDAILQADQIANNGQNQCLIWEVFASRGLGFSATQGESINRFDQTEAFDLPPSSILNCALTTEIFENRNVLLYPNPAKLNFTINFKNNINTNDVQLKIYNLNGQLIKETALNSNRTVNIEGFKPGVYMVKLISTDQSLTKKLIVK